MLNRSFIAFALLHVTVPVICVTLYGAHPLWIIGSLVFAAAIVRSLHSKSSTYVITALCLVSGLAFVLTLLLGASYYMQGEGFNDAFFYHLDTNTLVIAAQAYPEVFFPSLLFLFVSFFIPLLFLKREFAPGRSHLPVVLLWCAALIASYPILSLVQYRMALGDGLSFARQKIPTGLAETVPQEPKLAQQISEADTQTSKNIILIYAEGLEQLYFDREIFGDLMPNIRGMSEQAHQYTNVYQVRGAHWTIAGIVASQCGFPLVVSNRLASNSSMASSDNPFAAEKCLVDILQERGYETVYMGGAPLFFAGKGNFLKAHGYKKVLGRKDLTPLLQDPEYHMGWGLYDDSLFELALAELEMLEKGQHPYMLTLLTLDTHHPSGHPSRSCKKLSDNDNPMSNAIFCSDQLISQFIQKAMKMTNMEETVIVLLSDHLAMRNDLWDKLKAHKGQRRLTWMIFDNNPGTVSDQAATHFDVAPTILEAIGIGASVSTGFGTSLFAKTESTAIDKPPPVDAERVPQSLFSSATVKESGVDISYEHLTITVGELVVKVSKNGWEFRSGLFLIILNEDGNVTDTIYSDDFGRLVRELEGFQVVGISIQEKNSDFVDQYFYGRISSDLTSLTVQPLNADVHISAARMGM